MSQHNANDQPRSGGYRIKFLENEFLALLEESKTKRIYRVRNFYYFSYDGFVMYCDSISEERLVGYKIYNAIEFSNEPWQKR